MSKTMTCPRCGEETAVIDSRPTDRGITRRRRACVKCKFRFSTYEIKQTDLVKVFGSVYKATKKLNA